MQYPWQTNLAYIFALKTFCEATGVERGRNLPSVPKAVGVSVGMVTGHYPRSGVSLVQTVAPMTLLVAQDVLKSESGFTSSLLLTMCISFEVQVGMYMIYSGGL